MVFSSLTFMYLFLPICLFAYFLPAGSFRYKNYVLLIMSLFFYAWGEPKWIVLMILSTAVEYIGARFVDKYRGKPAAKVSLAISIGVCLSILFIFKYLNFCIFNINQIFSSSLSLLNLTLPIGISFYTFQTITYVVDVYRDKVPVQKNYAKLLLYVSMFPQLIAGPIVKYSDISDQLDNRQMDIRKAGDGVIRFLAGLFKKAVIANTAGDIAGTILDGSLNSITFVGAWTGLLAYTLQIYFDFSAYSDMAIGLGKLFGFDYPENFSHPYIAGSITDFWKRWHMTLTSFFREYLYIPLGGNRKHHVLNLLIVWFFTGLWHGAAWNFIVWGLYYFVLICLEKLVLRKLLPKWPEVFSHIYTMFFVMLGWAFFYYDDMSRLRKFLSVLFGFGADGFSAASDGTLILNHILFFAAAIIGCMPVAGCFKRLFIKVTEKSKPAKAAGDILTVIFSVFLLVIDTAAMVGSTYNPFLYFRF